MLLPPPPPPLLLRIYVNAARTALSKSVFRFVMQMNQLLTLYT